MDEQDRRNRLEIVKRDLILVELLMDLAAKNPNLAPALSVVAKKIESSSTLFGDKQQSGT